MILGFTFGGWVTGGTAAERAEAAASSARAELAAMICKKNFLASANAPNQLAALKEVSSWQRDSFIRDGGWVTFGGEPIYAAADLCADQLAEVELPALAKDDKAAPAATETVAN